VFQISTVAVALTLVTSIAFSADHSAPSTKPPTEVKIVSMPPSPAAQPSEMRIISMPAQPPAEVKVVSIPPDESTHNLVTATWGLLFATVVLAVATFLGSWWQSRDTRRRDRAAMLREVSRAAHKVMTEATRVEQIAERVLPARARLWSLRHDAPLPDNPKDEEGEKDLAARRAELKKMVSEANFVVTDGPDAMSPLLTLSDRELTQRLWNLDRLQVQLEAVRDAIAEELHRYDTESTRLRQHATTMRAAYASRVDSLRLF
jgi:hypothetical protein